ncbi:hypothetical protein ACWEQ4_00950 [Rhodococcus sp. NPDC003994]
MNTVHVPAVGGPADGERWAMNPAAPEWYMAHLSEPANASPLYRNWILTTYRLIRIGCSEHGHRPAIGCPHAPDHLEYHPA